MRSRGFGWWFLVCTLIIAIVGITIVNIRLYLDYHDAITNEVIELVDYTSLQYKLFVISQAKPETRLPVPVYGVSLSQIGDTWGAARSQGRTHEGVDIFAPEGTPIFSSTRGYVSRINFGTLGGNNVFVTGPGGVRYYYAHMERVALGVRVGMPVTPDTVLGFVGTTGNASNTPPHLHMGVYEGRRQPVNPYPLLVDREW